MKSGAIALLLAVAAVGTGAALYLLRDGDPRPGAGTDRPAAVAETGDADGESGLPGHATAQDAVALRPYETIDTLTEDLRDALAHGTPPLSVTRLPKWSEGHRIAPLSISCTSGAIVSRGPHGHDPSRQ